MPFTQSSQSLRSKLHLTEVSAPVLAGILALCIVAGVLAVQNVVTALNEPAFTIETGQDSSTGAQPAEGSSDSQDAPDAAQEQKTVVVFVSGCVGAPGVYELPEGARVADAVNAAGGFTEGAATDAVNLARTLSDGEQIAIVSQDSVDAAGAAGAQTGESSSGASAAAGQGAGASAATTATGLVNINTATQADLETLPGIGASTAQKILASREKEGPFASKEDIKRVSGIGDKKYEAIADLITV